MPYTENTDENTLKMYKEQFFELRNHYFFKIKTEKVSPQFKFDAKTRSIF